MRKTLENPKAGLILDYLLIVLGSCIFASGIAIFIKPAMISMGGVAGIALIGNYLTGLPLGVASIVLNVPLFIFGYNLLGREFFFKTIVSSVSYSVFIDVVGPFLPLFEGDRLLAALYGGIILGAGIGIVFKWGGTSGGTDILAKYLNVKFDISIGNANLVMNGLVIIACSSRPERISTWLSTATIMPIVAILKIKSTSIAFPSLLFTSPAAPAPRQR